MRIRKAQAITIAAVVVVLAIVGLLVLNGVMSEVDSGSNYYTHRPTFYNLPVIIYSDSSHTEEIREHISYCTFNYEITTNTSHIENASVDVPIIVDGYSLNDQNRQGVVDACSKALKNGSVVVALWSNAYDFMNAVSNAAYGHGAIGFLDNAADVLWFGLWHGNNSAQASLITYQGSIGQDGPSMTTLTEAYEWSVREVYDQPYHPSLYP